MNPTYQQAATEARMRYEQHFPSVEKKVKLRVVLQGQASIEEVEADWKVQRTIEL